MVNSLIVNWSCVKVFTLMFTKAANGNYFRVATAQGKQGIWLSLFPDRENTGNLATTTQGKFGQHREFPNFPKNKYFIVNCPFID